MRHINAWLDKAAARITRAVGTMWAAILFAALTFVSLPSVIASHDVIVIVQWVGSVFLQLVFLPIIMVGQDQQAAKTEAVIRETHDEVTELLTDVRELVQATHEKVTGGH